MSTATKTGSKSLQPPLEARLRELSSRLNETATQAKIINEKALKDLKKAINEKVEDFKIHPPKRKIDVLKTADGIFNNVEKERLIALAKIPKGIIPSPPQEYLNLRYDIYTILENATQNTEN